ncbi:hypothetical protein GGD83_004368 [Rhodoblastus sphagnicola]|nr:hypothetical protein [Rhodoblastus sphagnicola]
MTDPDGRKQHVKTISRVAKELGVTMHINKVHDFGIENLIELIENPQRRSDSFVAFRCVLTPELNGGWVDRVDAHGRLMVSFMPASALYHNYFCPRAVTRVSAHLRRPRLPLAH